MSIGGSFIDRGVEVKVTMLDKIVGELMELRWRMNKWEEMKNRKGWLKQADNTGQVFADQSQSYQFFLALRSSPKRQIDNDMRNGRRVGSEMDARFKRYERMK